MIEVSHNIQLITTLKLKCRNGRKENKTPYTSWLDFSLKQKLTSDTAVKLAAMLHSPNTTMNPNYLPATSATVPSYTQIGRL